MRLGAKVIVLLAVMFGLAACAQEAQQEQEAAAGTEMSMGQMYPNMTAPTILENASIVVQRLGSETGQWAGEHSHAGNQLAVVLRGGTQTTREGGEETERTFAAGDVFWVEATEGHDHAITAGGPTDAILVTFTGMEPMGGSAQIYPDLAADVVLENDHVIVQRLTAEPGVWAGEHSHAGGQLVVVTKGGTMTYREGGEETEVTYAEGDVFWIEATEAHDHGVTGDSSVEAMIITRK